MKDKLYITLIEQLMMILIFAITSALCIQVFIKADQISVDSKNRDKAVQIVQNTAEQLKANKEVEDVYYDKNWNKVESNQDYAFQLKIERSNEQGLETISIKVEDSNDGSTIFGIKVGR